MRQELRRWRREGGTNEEYRKKRKEYEELAGKINREREREREDGREDDKGSSGGNYGEQGMGDCE